MPPVPLATTKRAWNDLGYRHALTGGSVERLRELASDARQIGGEEAYVSVWTGFRAARKTRSAT